MTNKKYSLFTGFSASITTHPLKPLHAELPVTKPNHQAQISSIRNLIYTSPVSISNLALIPPYSSRFAPISPIPQHLSAAPYPIRRTSPSRLPFLTCYPSSHTTRLPSFATCRFVIFVYAALFGLTISCPSGDYMHPLIEPDHRTPYPIRFLFVDEYFDLRRVYPLLRIATWSPYHSGTCQNAGNDCLRLCHCAGIQNWVIDTSFPILVAIRPGCPT